MERFSNENDAVLDPFNGSGTTTKAAQILKRKAVGLDINSDYCTIAEERLKQQTLNI
jgi:DNA modification methylase